MATQLADFAEQTNPRVLIEVRKAGFRQAARVHGSFLAAIEKRALVWMAERMPAWINSDHLTALGAVAQLLAGVSYALARFNPRWLLATNGFIFLNWFGDSLDGTLARVRHIERPKYGYYLDHAVDAITTTVICAGIGLSSYVALPVALGVAIGYLWLSINVYLESAVFNLFDLGFGIFGPTEMRILLILANAGLFVGAVTSGLTGPEVAPYANIAFGIGCAGMAVAYLIRLRINLIRLARIEPPGRS